MFLYLVVHRIERSMTNLCSSVHFQRISYCGWLHFNEYRRNALANNVTAQVIMDENRNLFLRINQTPMAQWFKEQLGLGQEQRRGIKM